MPAQNITVTPVFEPDVKTLIVTQKTGGTIQVTAGETAVTTTANVKPGTKVTLANTVNTGYTFARYVIKYGGTEYPQTGASFSMPENDTEVWAEFAVNTDPPTFTTEEAPVGANVYIQNVTSVRATIVDASAAEPKTIDLYNITVPGHGSASASTYTSPVLTSSGDIRIQYVVTDSNNNSTTQYKTITVNAYQNPGISIQFERCDSDGTSNAVGTYFKYKGTASYTRVDNNYITEAKIIISNVNYTLTLDNAWHVISGYAQPIANSVSATVSITDKWKTSTIPATLANANFAIYLGGNGTSIGFGRATDHSDSIEVAYNKTIYIGIDTDPAHD